MQETPKLNSVRMYGDKKEEYSGLIMKNHINT